MRPCHKIKKVRGLEDVLKYSLSLGEGDEEGRRERERETVKNALSAAFVLRQTEELK